MIIQPSDGWWGYRKLSVGFSGDHGHQHRVQATAAGDDDMAHLIGIGFQPRDDAGGGQCGQAGDLVSGVMLLNGAQVKPIIERLAIK